MIDYLGQNLSKINPYLGEKGPKCPQNGLLPRNHLNIYSLGTTNAIKMKLSTIIYHHGTFHLVEKLGRNSEGVRQRKRKAFQNEPKNQFLDAILTNSLQ